MKAKHISIWLSAAGIAALGVCAQMLQAYRFYGKEAEHLWLNDSMWLTDHIATPGGIVQLLSSALTQMYAMPGAGAIVYAAVTASIVGALWAWGRRVHVLFLLPAVFLFLSHENGFYNLKGDIALMTAVLVGVMPRVSRRMVDVAVTVMGIALCYWTIGSATIVAALLIALRAAADRRWTTAVAAPLTALAVGCVLKMAGNYVTWTEAFTPIQYYDWPSTFFFQLYAWGSVVLIGVGIAIERKHSVRATEVMAFEVLSAVFVGVMGWQMYRAVHNEKNYIMRTEEYMARQGDWDGIISLREKIADRNCFVSYVNLALAERGLLTERLFEFRPYVVSRAEIMDMGEGNIFQGDAMTGASQQQHMQTDSIPMTAPLLMKSDELSRDGQKVQSIVMYAWGGAALCNAQKAAFETNMLTPGCCDPDELKRLVVTNAVFETPAVADKYLRRLQRTTFHRAWADSVIAHPKAFAATIDAMRRALSKDNALYMKTQIIKTLESVTQSNAKNEVAAQFYEAYLLLSKDGNGLLKWAERRHAQGKALGTLLQQAVIYHAHRTKRDVCDTYCRSLGVSEETIHCYYYPEKMNDYEHSYWNYTGHKWIR